MSKLSSANGSAVAVPQHRRHRDPGLVVDAPGVLQLAERQVEPDAAAAVAAHPARALAGAAADLEHVACR